MKTRRRNKSILWCLLLLLVMLPIKSYAGAEEDIVKQVGFTYKINHPDNQLTDSGALNLMMQPSQEQEVTVTIRNTNDQDVTLSLSLNGARTNSHGVIEYGPSKFKADKSMAYDLTDLVSMPNELVIPKQSEKEIVLKLKMPDVPFEGIVTGGVQMIEKAGEEKQATETGIVNKVAYLFGITLQMSETELEPELELQKVYPEQANFRNAVFLDIANIMPMKVEGLVLDVEITREGKTDVLYQSKKNNMAMAPNTLMSYPVSLDGEKMVAGKYTAHVVATAHGKQWKWEENFTITREQADLFNQKDVNLVQERGVDWKLIVMIAAGLSVAIIGIYYIRKSAMKKNVKKKTSQRKRE